ncbi:Tetratricopeptide TPR_2 repeat-containing protein [Alkalidesulfovibrio alkalitolerans DSM 16529]|uniref:Tetratricopeptide TPR_2 repeat-containing protein n=1 Tax=Alkalidesulfovibrio alkalitolerans DSM 16529 TaxID=1121439 RepID=S7UN92_9BACT|nr:tetratricopeptide repeat protein [Alkalidesulfovibrio alkalitolerans]EPR35479.1 Tetratricopeptide TPR_2 repeat-containing protein [Alkalidesulfovibrio alkalitolerans DSM 16529]
MRMALTIMLFAAALLVFSTNATAGDAEPCGDVNALLARLEPDVDVGRRIFERGYRERAQVARDVYDALSRLAPNDPVWESVRTDLCEGRLMDVRTALSFAAKDDHIGEKLFALAGVDYLAREYGSAAGNYIEAVQRKPDDPGFLAALGRMHYLAGEYAQAAPLFARAWRIEEDKNGQTVRAAELAEWVGDAHLALGDASFAAKVYEEAAVLYAETLGEEATSVGIALGKQGTALLEMQRLDQAEETLRQALAVLHASHGPDNPLVAETLRSLALAREQRREYGAAGELYLSALVSASNWYGIEAPELAPYLFGLGVARFHLGEYETALAALREARGAAIELYGPQARDLMEIGGYIALVEDALARRDRENAAPGQGDAPVSR